jgi:hypothetical protein
MAVGRRPPNPPPSRPPRRSGRDRTELWLAIAAPVVVFWLLLLFAPASSQFSVGERVGLGTFFAAFCGGFIWLRDGN